MTDIDVHEIIVNDKKFEALITSYVERRRIQARDLAAALGERRFEEIEQAGHNLYGSGSAYGLPRLTDIGRQLEAAALEQDYPALRRLIAEFDSYVNRLRVTLSR